MTTQEAAETGADRLVQALTELGVTVAFGLPGVHNLPIWEALGDSGVRLVGVRHEQTAVYAADGYARATGKLGVALVTTGPGAANTLGATGEALTSGSPVLVIATDIPAALRRPGVYRGVLHECTDQKAMFLPVVRGGWHAETASDIGPLTTHAANLARTAPYGPAYLGIPTDLLRAPAPAAARPAAVGADAEVARLPARDDLRAAAAMVAAAERPLVWAGRGALNSGAGRQVGELAEKIAAPVVTTYGGRGVVAPGHPCAVPGPVHDPAVGPLWDEADLVIAVGTDFDGMMTQNWAMPAPRKLITVNIDAADAAKNYPPDAALTGDAAAVLDAWLPEVAARGDLPALTARLGALGARVTASVRDDEPLAADLLDVLGRVVPPEAPIVCDMCIPGYWIAGYHPVPAARKLAYPMGWGTLGFGFPASVGSAIAMAAEDGRAVCVTGDGGFLFACGDLATVAQESVPLTVVLVDDGGYGMLRFDQVQGGMAQRGVDLRTPDFTDLARSFGIPAASVTGFGAEFEKALRDAVAADGPNLVVVDAAMTPPPTTSPRWYRKKGGH